MTTKNKIVRINSLRNKVRKLRRQGKKVVLTNGCFDLLHFGHVSYLEKIKKTGLILVVAINSDNSVKRIKGKGRPIQAEQARARTIATIECVDYVVIFDEDNPLRVIQKLEPDLLVKGSDWKKDEVVGKDFVKTYGGKVHLVDYIPGFSTTNIIQKIEENVLRFR